MIEKFKHPEGNNPSNKDGKISRRDFLKKAGEAAIFAALPFSGGLFGETSRAWSKEIKEGDSWIQGIEALRDESLHSNLEHSAWFIREKSGKESWERFSAGEETKVEREDSFFLDTLKQSPAEVKFTHSHPLTTFRLLFKSSPDRVAEMRKKEEQLPPSLPPSIEDVGLAIVLKTIAQKESPKTKFSHVVVEPGGIWKIEVDLTHPYANAIVRYDNALRALEKQLPEEEFNALLKTGANILHGSYPNPKEKPLMAEFFNVVDTLYGREGGFARHHMRWSRNYMELLDLSFRGKSDHSRLAHMIEAYKLFGATVTFTDYKSLGLSQKKKSGETK